MASSSLRNSSQAKPRLAKVTDHQLPSRPFASTVLGYARIILGAGSLLAPYFTCGVFKFDITNETATVVRLFGVRGVAFGQLLITTGDKSLVDGGRRELRRLLRANVGCDMIDVCSLVFAIINGHMDRLPGTMLAIGAAVCVAVGILGLKAV